MFGVFCVRGMCARCMCVVFSYVDGVIVVYVCVRVLVCVLCACASRPDHCLMSLSGLCCGDNE